ncbi:MAG: hypothetical protein LC795_07520 [Acidobacteria bacterium]|nr:hypothetical protein [Acidobacteriota bacterium]
MTLASATISPRATVTSRGTGAPRRCARWPNASSRASDFSSSPPSASVRASATTASAWSGLSRSVCSHAAAASAASPRRAWSRPRL